MNVVNYNIKANGCAQFPKPFLKEINNFVEVTSIKSLNTIE